MPQYLVVEIEVVDLQPRVWRRVLLKEAATFADLHAAIQDAGPWEDYHLWEFRDVKAGRATTCLAGPTDEEGWGDPVPAADGVRLTDVFKRKGKLVLYTYDMGDSWEHLVKFEGKQEHDEVFERRLIDGDRASRRKTAAACPGTTRACWRWARSPTTARRSTSRRRRS